MLEFELTVALVRSCCVEKSARIEVVLGHGLDGCMDADWSMVRSPIVFLCKVVNNLHGAVGVVFE